VNSKTGDIFFSWVESNRAKFSAEWATPQYIPSPSQANSSPDILVDDSGRIILAYAIPINEDRGIYFVESGDGGITWTQPVRVFDAAAAGWDIVDQPEIALTGNGRLHILFRKSAFQGNSSQPSTLYYSQSSDGGATWSDAETVSEKAVFWSAIVGYGQSTLHRFWQEDSQSMLVSFDQISQDGGTTWGSPMIVSNINSKNIMTTEAVDGAGNLHFLQSTSKDNIITLDQRIWDGSGWASQDPAELYMQDRAVPAAISAGVSSKGNLIVSILMNYPYLTNNFKSSIVSVDKSLGVAAEIQTPAPAIVPAIQPTIVATQAASESLPLATQVSALNQIDDSPSPISRNLVGILLIGGVLVLVIAIFRPSSKKQSPQGKSSR
jgi:hypothetical protein